MDQQKEQKHLHIRSEFQQYVTAVVYLLLRLVVSVGSFVRPCVRACVRTCEKRKRKPHARAPGCTFDL